MSKKSSNKRKEKKKIRKRKIRAEIQSRRNKFIALIERSIPDYPQISDWDIAPTPPFLFHEIDISRCFYSTIIIKDTNNVKYAFSFDLSNRLVYTAELFYPWEGMGFSEDRYAYIKTNSKLEREVFPAIESAIDDEIKKDRLYGLLSFRECLEKAQVYTKY